jgi:hypothetical protein
MEMGSKMTQRAERYFVLCAFLAYLTFQLHALAFHGYWGPDWINQKTLITWAAQDPWKFLTHYIPARTNPPLYYLLCVAVRKIAGLPLYLPVIGLINIFFGVAGACCAYAVIRKLIENSWLRTAAIVFFLFLPFAMIHAQAVAPEALATPLFWLLLWLVVRFRPQAGSLAFGLSVALICSVLFVSLLVKFTFVSSIPALLLWIVLLWRTGQLSPSRLAALLIVLVMAPAIFSYAHGTRFRAENGNIWNIQPISLKQLSKAEMNLRSITWLRKRDIDILGAPPYNLLGNRSYKLLENNRHSFAALLHLSIFTDILNIYQPDPYDYYFGSRTLQSNSRMQIAVCTGIAASVVTLFGILVLLVRSISSVVFQRNPRDLSALAVLLFSLAWFSALAVMLPIIPNPYYAGFWHPRLFAPAVLGFFISGFVYLDRRHRLSSRFKTIVLAYAIAQSVIHASFLWPVESNRKLIEFNIDVAASQAPAIWRVFDWQDNYGSNNTGEYWLDRMVGIVVNRPEWAQVENWKLSISLAPGPADPSSHRVVRISCRGMAPVVVEFDAKKDIDLEVPLGGGRNDVRVEAVPPRHNLEQQDEPLIRYVRISNIAFRRADGTSAKFSPP